MLNKLSLDIIMELSVSGHVLRWARQSKLSCGASLSMVHGWNLNNRGHFTVAKHMLEHIQACQS